MLSPTETLLFFLLVFICAVASYHTWGQMFRIINRGQGRLYFNDLPRRIWNGLLALFSQGDIISRRRVVAFFHYGVAYAFIFYVLVNLIDFLEGVIPGFLFLEGNILGNLYRLVADIFTILALLAVLFFLVRRFGRKDPALSARENVKLDAKARDTGIATDSLIVLLFIFIHIGGSMLASASAIALLGGDIWQPFSGLLANTVMMGWSNQLLNLTLHTGWWLALGSIVLFFPYFPFTKHFHLFMGPLNFMTRPDRTYPGQLFTLDFEDESIEQFGAATLFDLPKTQVLDTFACIMCNRCQEVCPAYSTGKELSPAALEINKRYYTKDKMAALANGEDDGARLMDYAISASAVWACTACGHCTEVCPVGNAPMLDILEIRRDQVLMESNFPDELKSAFVGLERAGNPWQSTENRMDWAKPLDFNVPTVQENPDYEVLLWVGCAGAFNPDAQRTVRAVATIMHEAGVSFAVLGEAESCTGDAARRAGNEYLFWEMAQGNIEVLNEAGADKKRIVTSCPHCFTTIGKEYGELGGHYEVFHHTQLIADLIGRGKLRLNGNTLEKVTFHDPCYLGRQNGIISEPRVVLAEAGATLLEMDRSGRDSFCCGAGGAQYWKEEEHGDVAVNAARFAQAKKTGAETLAVGCPFCATMMIDANREDGEPMQVRDVAELVADSLGR